MRKTGISPAWLAVLSAARYLLMRTPGLLVLLLSPTSSNNFATFIPDPTTYLPCSAQRCLGDLWTLLLLGLPLPGLGASAAAS